MILSVAVLRIGNVKKIHPAVLEKTLEHQLILKSKIKNAKHLDPDVQIRIRKYNEQKNLLELKKQSIQKEIDTPNSVIETLRFLHLFIFFFF